jgi:hypothetical protein
MQGENAGCLIQVAEREGPAGRREKGQTYREKGKIPVGTRYTYITLFFQGDAVRLPDIGRRV